MSRECKKLKPLQILMNAAQTMEDVNRIVTTHLVANSVLVILATHWIVTNKIVMVRIVCNMYILTCTMCEISVITTSKLVMASLACALKCGQILTCHVIYQGCCNNYELHKKFWESYYFTERNSQQCCSGNASSISNPLSWILLK